MTFTFYPDLPAGIKETPRIISGKGSPNYGSTYLVAKQDSGEISVFDIKHQYNSYFSQAEIVDRLLMVGFEDYFYIYDLVKNKNVLALHMNGYFGHFYINEDRVYVADAGSLYCVSMYGKLVWASNSLGIDGVIVHDFETNKIYGSGEWDPPGGWRDFVLDIKTGKLVE